MHGAALDGAVPCAFAQSGSRRVSGDEHIARHVFVRGRVQGVGYRAWVEGEAVRRGLEGFVRNRRDGSVEALFVGPAEAVAGMVAACRRGPPVAHVTAIEEHDGAPPLRQGFAVLPTA
jgi:acylphosphatase